MPNPHIGAVIIGRNEGPRLAACFASLKPHAAVVVYVDSGSTDDSLDLARAAGVMVVELPRSEAFTAARARNAGLAVLAAAQTPPDFVQFVDGDCELREDWLRIAASFLASRPRAAVACGRRRERHPEASIYNRLCDWEWDTPVGPAAACGGDSLMRFAAVTGVGGFRESLIAGEEPELCLRLRSAGWEVWRLDAEMTWHDAAITRFGQWWRRARRAGHAFAEGAALHGRAPERHFVRETRRALIWGIALPLVAGALAFASPAWLGLALLYPAQVVRLAAREGASRRESWERACLTVLGKLAEGQGVIDFLSHRLVGRRKEIIEYKQKPGRA